jgi:hypothetical protein
MRVTTRRAMSDGDTVPASRAGAMSLPAAVFGVPTLGGTCIAHSGERSRELYVTYRNRYCSNVKPSHCEGLEPRRPQ